ncbi:MAG: DUF2973 domain-containing protein [Leptolyngbyaceae bacterium]|nr:DUF2973 domain-containing protein [Leptolyngbyaceae bacterium]
MLLPLIYIIAFTVLAFLAISNLIRNLMMLGAESRRPIRGDRQGKPSVNLENAHPELLDESGQVVREPYLVMRSVSMEDARERLDAIYKSSPGTSDSDQDDSLE